MKKIILMTILLCSSLFAQGIKCRESESKHQQRNIVYSQGGILFRFNHKKLQKMNFENKKEDFWRCKELWIAKNVRAKKVKEFVQIKLPKMKLSDLDKFIGIYKINVKIDTTASWTKKDIIKKMLELEKRVEKLEKP